MVTEFLAGGAVNAAVLAAIAFLLSRFVGDIYGRALLAIFLFIASGAYVGFAVGAGVSGLWVLAELAHVIVIGAMGLLGLRGSPYWLAAGWALHPLWISRSTTTGPAARSHPPSGRSPVSVSTCSSPSTSSSSTDSAWSRIAHRRTAVSRAEQLVIGPDQRPPACGNTDAAQIRVTHVLRRIDGEWRLVHRHADFPPKDQRQA